MKVQAVTSSNGLSLTSLNEYKGANVIFFNILTNKPELFMDTLKVSSIENESETAEARGGRGNNKLIAWDYGRTANLSISDALLSDTTIAMLAGNEMKTTGIKVVGREQLIVGDGDFLTKTVELKKTALTNSLAIYKYENGLLGAEVEADDFIHSAGTITFTDVPDNTELMVFYEYSVEEGKGNQITFSGEKFPATYRVVGETLVRGEDGVDRVMQFEIPKAKMQSTFSLTMDVENVGTFDFTLEVLMDAQSKEKELYKVTRLDNDDDN